MAKVQVEDTSALASDLEHAQDDPSVTDIATLYDLGFAELTQKQQQRFGPYLPILAYEGDIANMLGIHTSEGRLPENGKRDSALRWLAIFTRCERRG